MKLSSDFNSRNEAIFRDLIKDIIRFIDIPENCVTDVLLFCNPCKHVVLDDKIIRPYMPKKSQKYKVTIRGMSFSVTTNQIKGNVASYCNYNIISNSITTCGKLLEFTQTYFHCRLP